MSNKLTKDSIFLSLILGHKPELVGINILDEGWVFVESLLKKCKEFGRPISFDDLREIVSTDSKKRYSFKNDFQYIRANQGHSVDVDMKFKPLPPPLSLFHGTAKENLKSIEILGILRGNRQFVHLTKNFNTAKATGERHGESVVLKIDSSKMSNDGYVFYCSENEVWMTEHIPFKYVSVESNMSFWV